jgi:prepilin-type N-terminal cleavage/methylation domain-containing protein
MQPFCRVSCRRNALTLLEVVVAIAIVAVLTGLLLVAIFKVRNEALKVTSRNNLRQIALATHHFVSAKGERLPMLDGSRRSPNPNYSALGSLIPFADGQMEYTAQSSHSRGTLRMALYLSPADPTLADSPHRGAGLSSYAPNAVVFGAGSNLPASFPDGTSKTILVAEHYAYYCQSAVFWFGATSLLSDRRASFADELDVRPTTTGQPPVTRPSIPGLTFQAAPRKRDCNPLVAQTPHPDGMLVAMADGSVRTIAPNVHSEVYWALVTPSGGETPDGEW